MIDDQLTIKSSCLHCSFVPLSNPTTDYYPLADLPAFAVEALKMVQKSAVHLVCNRPRRTRHWPLLATPSCQHQTQVPDVSQQSQPIKALFIKRLPQPCQEAQG
uniref:Uncharacterized protein n=1 Tax=Nothobranchius kuhntae TaxID=321403 RepID=A0A1A8KYI6_NOTKU